MNRERARDFPAWPVQACYLNSGGPKGGGPAATGVPMCPPLRRSHAEGKEVPMDLGKNLKIDSVSRLNPAPPRHVHPRQTVAEAVELMRKEQVGCVLVCDANKLVGIFTDRDLTRRVLAAGKP